MLNYLAQLAAHGAWANARLIEAASRASGDRTRVLRELGHILGASEAWMARIEGRAQAFPAWPTFEVEELARLQPIVDTALHDLLGTLTVADLDRQVEYANSTGTVFRTPLAEILLHLLTHGQYHRGKVNTLLPAAGGQAVGVDVIVWLRETGHDRT